MKLPSGITGFYEKQNKPPTMDGHQFKQICFSQVKGIGGMVIKFKEPEGTNFFDVEVSFRHTNIHILLNAHYPFLAFASLVDFDHIRFVDESNLTTLFMQFYRVLTVAELNKPLRQLDNGLNQAEWEQIAYWKPERIGDIIFNYWD